MCEQHSKALEQRKEVLGGPSSPTSFYCGQETGVQIIVKFFTIAMINREKRLMFNWWTYSTEFWEMIGKLLWFNKQNRSLSS